MRYRAIKRAAPKITVISNTDHLIRIKVRHDFCDLLLKERP